MGAAPRHASDELAGYERRLRRSARSGADEVHDPALAHVLEQVHRRRAARLASDVRSLPEAEPVATGPVTAGAEAGAGGAILAVEPVGSSIRLFRIVRPRGFAFRAGQYAKLGVPGQKARDFSIASAPHEANLELCIERMPGGRLTPVLFGLGVGDRLEVASRAKGSFVVDDRATTHLMVATTTGIAPLRSMLRDLRHRGAPARVVVLHGASHADELPYLDELEALAATDERVAYLPTVSRPSEARNRGWTGRRGRVDALAREVAATLDPATTRVYACGQSAMVSTVRSDLGRAGFRVSTETFD
jgi:ferredoxin--NADP+ reductase